MVLENEGEITVARVERFHHEMLDLDIVVRARQTQAGGGLQGVSRLRVQLADQASQIDVHGPLAPDRFNTVSSASRPKAPVRIHVHQPSGAVWPWSPPITQLGTSS